LPEDDAPEAELPAEVPVLEVPVPDVPVPDLLVLVPEPPLPEVCADWRDDAASAPGSV
jgi:hypothetical protein